MIAFVNCFTIPAGREEEFLELWKVVNLHMAAKPGYVDHQLHRSLDPNAPFRFVNFAHWDSVDSWRAAHDDDFRALVTAPQWHDFTSVPGLYEDEPVHQGASQRSNASGLPD